ncbi:hypothetical protein PIB30_069714 [Stylosanthes scabra]|uniref:Uncharacterized protein n=1 Tax=Stylosanthes scabra TaxID=79078 RepID=A0ABU6UQG1_9FABA|nr:hypothetical protein [Stylosanthes scabra]
MPPETTVELSMGSEMPSKSEDVLRESFSQQVTVADWNRESLHWRIGALDVPISENLSFIVYLTALLLEMSRIPRRCVTSLSWTPPRPSGSGTFEYSKEYVGERVLSSAEELIVEYH